MSRLEMRKYASALHGKEKCRISGATIVHHHSRTGRLAFMGMFTRIGILWVDDAMASLGSLAIVAVGKLKRKLDAGSC